MGTSSSSREEETTDAQGSKNEDFIHTHKYVGELEDWLAKRSLANEPECILEWTGRADRRLRLKFEHLQHLQRLE